MICYSGIMAQLIKIYLRPERRAETIEHTTAILVPGTGIEGDHFKKGSRQVTLLSQRAWEEVCDELGKKLDPKLRRANLVVDDLDFNNSLGKIVTAGSIRIKITGETKPCRLMDESCPGLKDALSPDWRGGVFGEVLDKGSVAVGDMVKIS